MSGSRHSPEDSFMIKLSSISMGAVFAPDNFTHVWHF